MRNKLLFAAVMLVASCLALSCSREDDPSNAVFDRPLISVGSVLSIPENGGDIQISFLSGNGPRATDKVVLRPENGSDIVIPIKSVSTSCFVFTVPEGLQDGDYGFCLQRDDRVWSYGKVKLVIGLVAPDPGPYVYGKVLCDGEGVPGVVVSDGFACAVTDKKGLFTIESPYPERASFAFASVPSGYEPLLVNGLPVFFAKLPSYVKDVPREAIIELKKAERSQDNHKMFITADLQVRPFESKWAEQIAFRTYDTAGDCFREMRDIADASSCPCYSVCLGDLVFNTPESFEKYNEWGKGIGFPFYAVIGNHDHVPSGNHNDDSAAKKYEDVFGPRNYSVNIGGVHYVTLDNVLFEETDGKMDYVGGLEDAVLEWLTQDMSHVDKSTPVFIFSHIPFAAMAAVANVRNNTRMLSLLSSYKEVYLWAGHVHENRFSVFNSNGMTIEHHTLVRTGGFQPPNDYLSPDGVTRGFAEISVDNGKVTWQYVPITYQTGKSNASSQPAYKWREWDYVNGKAVMRDGSGFLDRKHQMSLFPNGAYGDSYIYANVYFWDDKWKSPKITIDGKTYNMAKYTATYDPGHDEIMTHYESINKQFKDADFSHTTKIYHMFRYKVPAGTAAGTATVSVTDRFGNTYTGSVTVNPS